MYLIKGHWSNNNFFLSFFLIYLFIYFVFVCVHEHFQVSTKVDGQRNVKGHWSKNNFFQCVV